MHKFDFSLFTMVYDTKGNLFSPPQTIGYSGLPENALPHVIEAAASVGKVMADSAKKHGHLHMIAYQRVTALDGGTVPPGANSPVTHLDGITLHGLADIEDAMMAAGSKLLPLGRQNATAKEGPKK